MPDGQEEQGLRIRISGTRDPGKDRHDLMEWLSQEDWFLERRKAGWVRIDRSDGGSDGQHRSSGGEGGPSMGEFTHDLLLVVATAVVQEPVRDLYDLLKVSVANWLENRRVTSGDGEDPQAEVDPPDGMDPPDDAPGDGDGPDGTGPGTGGE
ncbi:hypothetical protein CUT44_24070 [Streptomyces carminius]|uniref:Uncharacterized protein n=1 Tax=Streptomyces carminius TaxID=2665496 RepID=A0A2M8LTS7_9ACTN|nr:hypothetical protein [Streptomyces carminius]PJE95361.1 hypothetical protein CUT44_24070 [Streptomyces carminius]